MPLFSLCTRALSADHVPSGRVPIACPSRGSDANDALQTRHAQQAAASQVLVMLQQRHAWCVAALDRHS